ncbi:HAD-IA family hydrolase [uncultured Clostridium sp.]|uniref:HAD family hydrolase n=1 Tax=uncultured Clostridium sp. TaxID=59620 RepID=UPI0025D00E57|nr:HAD-IA family hydrolase [uncultured Clostridium sp.]
MIDYRNNLVYNKIFGNIEKYDVYSFDIFDTLLFRTVADPKDLFIKVYDEVRNSNIELPFDKYEFRSIRILAENKARSKKMNLLDEHYDNEVNLFEIYDEIKLNNNIKKIILKKELDIERKVTYLNPIMNNIINELLDKGKKVVLISDMYLSQLQIKNILKYNKFLVDKVRIYVSSDLRYTKSSGKLFKYVMNELNIKQDKILHIGDNEISDIDGAKKCGIDSLKYDLISNKEYTFELEKLKFGRVLPEIESLRCLAPHFYNKDDNFWFKFGYSIMGPFLTCFSQWVVDNAVKYNVDQIRPLMREGVILTKTIKNAAIYNKLDLDIKPLFLSRESTTLPGLYSCNDEFVNKLFERRFSTVKDLLKSLNILKYLKKEDKCINNNLNINVSKLTVNGKKIIKTFIEKHKEDINSEIRERSRILYNYLDQEINLDEKFLTVDLGYRGTMQNNIHNLLKKYSKENLDIHLLAIGSEYLVNYIIKGMNIQSYISEFNMEDKSLITSIMWEPGFIEELTNDHRGSTIKYEIVKDKVIPVLQNSLIPKEEFSYKKSCQRGILKFQKLFYQCLWKKVKCSYKKNIEAILPIIRVLEVPTLEEAQHLINLHHDQNLGTNYVSTFITKRDIRLIRKYGIDKFLDIAYTERVSWPQGVVTLIDNNFLINRTIQESRIKPKYYNESINVLNRLSRNSIKNVIVYGAGEIGRTFTKFLKLNNIKIKFIVDKKKSLWGNYLEDIPIVSLSNITKDDLKNTAFVVASVSFMDEIRETLINKFNRATIICIKN